MHVQFMNGVVERIEPDGFGIVREAVTDRRAFFTREMIKSRPEGKHLQIGTSVVFGVVDADLSIEVMSITSLEAESASNSPLKQGFGQD